VELCNTTNYAYKNAFTIQFLCEISTKSPFHRKSSYRQQKKRRCKIILKNYFTPLGIGKNVSERANRAKARHILRFLLHFPARKISLFRSYAPLPLKTLAVFESPEKSKIFWGEEKPTVKANVRQTAERSQKGVLRRGECIFFAFCGLEFFYIPLFLIANFPTYIHSRQRPANNYG